MNKNHTLGELIDIVKEAYLNDSRHETMSFDEYSKVLHQEYKGRQLAKHVAKKADHDD